MSPVHQDRLCIQQLKMSQIRTQLAKEWQSDLLGVSEENAGLLRESLTSSLDKMFTAPSSSDEDDMDGGVILPNMRKGPE